jgi:hypothetical protein
VKQPFRVLVPVLIVVAVAIVLTVFALQPKFDPRGTWSNRDDEMSTDYRVVVEDQDSLRVYLRVHDGAEFLAWVGTSALPERGDRGVSFTSTPTADSAGSTWFDEGVVAVHFNYDAGPDAPKLALPWRQLAPFEGEKLSIQLYPQPGVPDERQPIRYLALTRESD